MAEPGRAGWQPETDVDYGQRLVGFMLLKHRGLLLVGAIVASIIAFTVSIFMPPSYRSDGSIVVDKALSSQSSLLTGILSPMGGANTQLESEKQVLVSREIARQVIDELGLQIEVVDSRAPESPQNRILKYLHLARKNRFTREEIYNKLHLTNVQVNPDLQTKAEYELKTTADGAVSIGGKKFQPGQTVELSAASFKPVFGPAHIPGQSYDLTVLPAGQSYLDWHDRLGVLPVNDKANVLRVSFKYHNPFVCKQVVESVTAKYFSRYSSNSTENYDAILDYISSEITTTRARSDKLTAELTKFRETHKAYAPDAQGQAAMSQIADLSRTITENRISQASIESALRAMKAKTPEQIYDLIQAPATQLPLEAELMSNLSSSINALTQARQTKTEAHPDVQRLNASIKVLIGQIKDSLGSNLTQLKMADTALSKDLGELKGSLLDLPESEGKVALLMAELDANGEILKALATSEAQTKLKRASTTTDIQRLDEPTVPEKPDSPHPLFNAVLGGIIGLVLAILIGLVLEVADPRIRTLREIRLGLNLPVIGVLPGPAWSNRRWRPMQRDENVLRRIAYFMQCQGRVIGLVHPMGIYGGYDLAWGLSGVAADAGKPALLVDADRLNQGLMQALDKSAGDGLAEVAAVKTELGKVLISLSEDRRLLSLGKGALERASLEPLLTDMRGHFESVFICLPSPLRWVDQDEFTGLMDLVVIVIPQHGVTREELQIVVAGLRQRGIEPRGVVVTNFAKQRDVLGRTELQQVAVPLEA